MDRRDMILAVIAKESIFVEDAPLKTIASKAMVEWKMRNETDFLRNSRNFKSLAHWMLNHIRHNMTNYDALMDRHAKKTPSAMIAIRRKVYEAIRAQYPMLSLAIDEQLKHKFA